MKEKIGGWLEWLTDEPFAFARRAITAAAVLTFLGGLYSIFKDQRSGLDARSSGNDPGQYEEGLSIKGEASLEDYLGPIRKRTLFRVVQNKPPQPVAVKPAAPAAPPVPVKTLADLSADFSLVGVLQSAEPQAIILNRKSQKTHYVSAGQTIGEVRIVKIQQDRVTLGYNQ